MTQEEELQNKLQDQLFFSYSANVLAYEFLLLLCSVLLIGKSQSILCSLPFILCAALKASTYQINCIYIRKFQEGRSVDFYKKLIPMLDYIALSLFVGGLLLLLVK